jgi:hypothetical protein
LDWNGRFVDLVAVQLSAVLVKLVDGNDFLNPSKVFALLLSAPLQSLLCLGRTEDRRERKEDEYDTLSGEFGGVNT